MSDATKPNTQFTDEPAIRRAAAATGAEVLGSGSHYMGDGQRLRGFGVRIPGLRLPVVFDLYTGAAVTEVDSLEFGRAAWEAFARAYAREAAAGVPTNTSGEA